MRELFAIRKKKKRNSQGKDLRTFEEKQPRCEKNSQGEDQRTFEGNNHGKGPKTFQEEAIK